jgi:hypothetical protein
MHFPYSPNICIPVLLSTLHSLAFPLQVPRLNSLTGDFKSNHILENRGGPGRPNVFDTIEDGLIVENIARSWWGLKAITTFGLVDGLDDGFDNLQMGKPPLSSDRGWPIAVSYT